MSISLQSLDRISGESESRLFFVSASPTREASYNGFRMQILDVSTEAEGTQELCSGAHGTEHCRSRIVDNDGRSIRWCPQKQFN
jgi:hypothetical protein